MKQIFMDLTLATEVECWRTIEVNRCLNNRSETTAYGVTHLSLQSCTFSMSVPSGVMMQKSSHPLPFLPLLSSWMYCCTKALRIVAVRKRVPFTWWGSFTLFSPYIASKEATSFSTVKTPFFSADPAVEKIRELYLNASNSRLQHIETKTYQNSCLQLGLVQVMWLQPSFFSIGTLH